MIFRRSFYLYDHTRLDHFIGFYVLLCLLSEKTAAEGSFQVGQPGLFDVAYKQLGPLPFYAEDLGQLLFVEHCFLSRFPWYMSVSLLDGDCRYYTSSGGLLCTAVLIRKRLWFVESSFTGGQ